MTGKAFGLVGYPESEIKGGAHVNNAATTARDRRDRYVVMISGGSVGRQISTIIPAQPARVMGAQRLLFIPLKQKNCLGGIFQG